jgi:pimeloyl-ACP methyl ester carboxylesterase
MTETPVTFADGYLAGTLLRPPAASNDWALLLLNAGILPRQGPHRFNVKLARAAAEFGVPSLRFDLSGLGDSSPPREARAWREQAAADIVTAVDFALRELNCRRVALVGICSGADNGLTAAMAEPRINGLFMLDGYAYPTRKTYWLRWAKRVRPARLRQRGPQWLREKLAAWRFQSTTSKDLTFVRGEPPREEFAARLQLLIDRGAHLRLLYSGSLHDQYNYAGQFADAFAGHRFVAQVQCDFVPDVDHTLTALHAQRHVLATVCDWLRTLRTSGETTSIPVGSRADQG